MATTTPIPGKLSKLSVSTDGGTTWLPVLGRVDMTLNPDQGRDRRLGTWIATTGATSSRAARTQASISRCATCRVMRGQEALIDNYCCLSAGGNRA